MTWGATGQTAEAAQRGIIDRMGWAFYEAARHRSQIKPYDNCINRTDAYRAMGSAGQAPSAPRAPSELTQNNRHPTTCELGVKINSLPHGKKTPKTVR